MRGLKQLALSPVTDASLPPRMCHEEHKLQ